MGKKLTSMTEDYIINTCKAFIVHIHCLKLISAYDYLRYFGGENATKLSKETYIFRKFTEFPLHLTSADNVARLAGIAFRGESRSNENFGSKWDGMTPDEREEILGMKVAGHAGEDKRALAYNSFSELPTDISNGSVFQ